MFLLHLTVLQQNLYSEPLESSCQDKRFDQIKAALERRPSSLKYLPSACMPISLFRLQTNLFNIFKRKKPVRQRNEDNDWGFMYTFFNFHNCATKALVIPGCYVYPHAQGLRLHRRKNSWEPRVISPEITMWLYSCKSNCRLPHSLFTDYRIYFFMMLVMKHFLGGCVTSLLVSILMSLVW